ncbi:hypothetical protein AWH62_06560 [Maricaulis sp. W15]|uniref:hypothetical protein n=1 Tax=Maricaulis sp. W15 TaxID=1772333 RepID=UPI000948C5F2|nr:hypothetical protein [Maricaulis sp. W15]OLF75473.1 hypothetical protein AWH62_06560 [Maricaulis sp. W15]
MILRLASIALITCTADQAKPTTVRPDLQLLEQIAVAQTINAEAGDIIWPGFADAPDSVLLIHGEQESLLCHDGPANGFARQTDDAETGCTLATRDRVFPPNMLASFPAIDGVPTIVVGTPEATGLTLDSWMMTLIHEHMHQMQDSQPGQYEQALALGLSGDDQTSMWILNYPFPYARAETIALARELADTALTVLAAPDRTALEAGFADYLDRRAAFLASVSEADARYYEMQSWKEGVARWTELAVMRESGRENPRHRQLAAGQLDRMIAELTQLDLEAQGRVAFYALGSAEAEMLERLDPSWREIYWQDLFSMGAAIAAVTPPALPAASSD